MKLKYFESQVKKSNLRKLIKQNLTNKEIKEILDIILTPKGLNTFLKFHIGLIAKEQKKNKGDIK